MKVFVFDLLAYDANLDHLKGGETELPYPLAKRHFDAATAMRTYEEHLDAWEALDRFGYDGVGFNEHHCSPYGLMNSPNLMASAAAQRTKNLKLRIYGNLLPLHAPPRPAEDLATHHPRPPVARHHRLRGRQQGAGAEGVRAAHSLFQPHPVQPRQFHRDRNAARDRLRQPSLDRLRASGEPARRRQSARGFPP